MYTYTRAEAYIEKHLRLFGIEEPSDLSIENIASVIKLTVKYWEFTSESVYKNGVHIVFLDESSSSEQQWQDFTHELCHVLWHVGRQEYLPHPFRQLQEWQADYFSQHLAVPTFMLEELKPVSVYEIMNLFNVECDFALKRLEMYERKVIDAMQANRDKGGEALAMCSRRLP